MLELSDYQVLAKDFLIGREFAGLFDLPGVGKTAPTIQAAWEERQRNDNPILVTCPAYLVENWEREISRFTSGATVSCANGDGPRARHAALQAGTDFVIQSYANWSARSSGLYSYPELTTRQWAVCVFDEGHKLRGRNSQCTKHVFELRRARGSNVQTPVWVLTGTPIVNNPGDIYPLLHLWRKRDYKSYWNFVGEWCKVVKTPWATEVGQLRRGLDEEFQELLGEFSMRRTLADIPSLASLDQRDRDYFVTLPPSVNAAIAKAREEYVIDHEDLEKSEFVSGGGALYAKLRQMATLPPTREKPKVDFVRDFLEYHQGPVVIYTWYKNSAKGVAQELTGAKRPVTLITGEVPAHRRGELVAQWESQKNGVLVATISSLKEGISLVHASDVLFLEHSELPSDQEQCIARLKRRGQTRLVNVHHVYARNTPDMAIKRHLTERTLGLKRALTSWLRELE